MSAYRIEWSSPPPTKFQALTFSCGYCGADIASEKGFAGRSNAGEAFMQMLLKIVYEFPAAVKRKAKKA
jgi:hypothetical protein